MIDLQELQSKIWENKKAKGFNTSDVALEFALTHGDMGELFEAYRKNNLMSEKSLLM